ncbi:MAG: phosphate transport system regulator PhoU, partial [Methylotenera sp.]|nr:phosphate transport system regulator PhoU [Methylotenera sp.]
MQSEHIFKQYDAELEAVRAKVLEMGTLVEHQIVDSLESLVTSIPSLSESVIKRDHL